MNRYNPPVEQCYFCKGSDLKHFADAAYWKEYELKFVKCSGCGLIFANPMPSIESIIEGNRALNILHVSRGTLSQYRGGMEFAFTLKSFKPSGVLLDVGCAEGFFLLGVRDNSSWEAEGTEIIESAVEFAEKQLNLKIYSGTLDVLENCTGKYDFIRMNNVIEHVQDPLRFLEIANKIMKPGGRVHCSTPNGFQDGAVLKEANKRGIKINLLENHFFYYHPETLSDIFKSCGFKILKAYCEDVKHSLSNFGLLPWFRYARKNQDVSLSQFRDKKNESFLISKEEIESMKKDPSLKPWRLKFNNFRKNYLRIHTPPSIAIGHQQYILAEKT